MTFVKNRSGMTAQTIHKTRLVNKATRLCFIAITASLLVSCSGYKHIGSSTDKNEGWTLVKVEKDDTPSWQAYSRKLSGTNFLEYKIEGEISFSPEACVASFKHDIEELANGSENKKFPIYDIVQKTEDSLLTYVIHNEPFPLKDTEMSVRYIYFNDEDGRTGVKWHEAWGEQLIEPSKKLNRVETFRGSWNFSPTLLGSTKAVNTVQFDPQKMPRWLVEPMVIKFIRGGLEDIKEKASEYHAGNASHSNNPKTVGK